MSGRKLEAKLQTSAAIAGTQAKRSKAAKGGRQITRREILQANRARLTNAQEVQARPEEAVAAYREALKERTRERAPLDWARA